MAGRDFHIKFPNYYSIWRCQEKSKLSYNLVPSPWNVSLVKLYSPHLTTQPKMSLLLGICSGTFRPLTPTNCLLYLVYNSTLTFMTATYCLTCSFPYWIDYEPCERRDYSFLFLLYSSILHGPDNRVTDFNWIQVVFFDSLKMGIVLKQGNSTCHMVLESFQVLLNEMAPWSSRGSEASIKKHHLYFYWQTST